MDLRYIALPYCLKKMPKGGYIVLNRKYKPIGFDTTEHLTYENFPVTHKIKGLNKKTAKHLSWNGSDDVECIFLYNDGCVPTRNAEHMKNYLDKLSRLAKYKC